MSSGIRFAVKKIQRAEWLIRAPRAIALVAVITLASAATVSAQPQPTVRGEIIDRVLAVVAGDVIMLSDVAAARDLGFVQTGAAANSIRTVLSRLIDRALVLAEVERYAPPEPAADAIGHEMQAVRARFPSDQAYS